MKNLSFTMKVTLCIREAGELGSIKPRVVIFVAVSFLGFQLTLTLSIYGEATRV